MDYNPVTPELEEEYRRPAMPSPSIFPDQYNAMREPEPLGVEPAVAPPVQPPVQVTPATPTPGQTESPMIVDSAGTIRPNPNFERPAPALTQPYDASVMQTLNPEGKPLDTITLMQRHSAVYSNALPPNVRQRIQGEIAAEKGMVMAQQAQVAEQAQWRQDVERKAGEARAVAQAQAEGRLPAEKEIEEIRQGGRKDLKVLGGAQAAERQAERLAAKKAADDEARTFRLTLRDLTSADMWERMGRYYEQQKEMAAQQNDWRKVAAIAESETEFLHEQYRGETAHALKMGENVPVPPETAKQQEIEAVETEYTQIDTTLKKHKDTMPAAKQLKLEVKQELLRGKLKEYYSSTAGETKDRK